MKRPSGSMAVALVALFVALGGTSIAASRYLITNANQISPHATYQLAVALSHKLRAQAGEQGMPGSEGKGAQGPTGPRGNDAPGLEGPQGKTGPEGKEGAKGATGTTGTGLFATTVACQSGLHDTARSIEQEVLPSAPETPGVSKAVKAWVGQRLEHARIHGCWPTEGFLEPPPFPPFP